jgi:hypothetical protein
MSNIFSETPNTSLNKKLLELNSEISLLYSLAAQISPLAFICENRKIGDNKSK